MDNTLSESLAGLTKEIDINATFGEPRTMGTRTVIPVAEISYTFDLTQRTHAATTCCSESRRRTNARTQPIAYVEIDEEGIHVEPLVDRRKITLAGILLAGWAAGWLGVVLKKILRSRA